MNPETFFDKFGMLADTPNGVQKLRELILQLAVQGKLVPQDPNDEPAAVLLEKIKAERERLVKEKKIKRSKALPPIDVEQIPYDLPNGWEWVHLGDVGHDLGQKKPDMTFTYIDVSAINKEQGIISNDVNILEPHEAPSRARKLVSKGSVIYATVRPYLLNIAIIDKQFEPEPIVSTAFAVLHPFSGILNKYLYYYLRSKPFILYVESEMTGMAYPAINDGKLYKGLVPVPPSNEQKRIVAKVDHLMALCDELEARQQKKQEARLHLNSAALDRLLTAHEPDEFVHHWQRICDNFDLLYGAPETVGELRKAILQLAVQGKLVRQDSNDEPAAVRLERIKAEKERLVKEKKIKVTKALPPIKGDEWPYELPKEWKLVRLGELVESMTNGIYKPSKYYSDNGIACLRMYNIQKGKINYLNLKRMLLDDNEIEQYRLVSGDLLVNRVNSRELVGKAGVINLFEEPLIFESKNIRVRFIICEELPEYINILFQTREVREVFEGDAKQTCGQASISQPQVAGIITPLPPLNEQKRIVAKVDHLMALCDELEAKIEQSQNDGAKLMAAVVHQLVTT